MRFATKMWHPNSKYFSLISVLLIIVFWYFPVTITTHWTTWYFPILLSDLLNNHSVIVYPDGKVCISILHPPGTDEYNNQESADERWRPILGVESIILSVISMLNDPNISSPANIDAAVEYRDNYDSYKKKVRKLTIQSVDSLWWRWALARI